MAETDVKTPTPLRRLPRREMWIDLPEPFEGFRILGWMNFPPEIGADLRSGEEERITPALLRVILDHDLVDYDGNPYPPASDPTFWDVVPTDVGRIVYRTFLGHVGELPKATGTR